MPWTNKKPRRALSKRKKPSKHTLRFRGTTGPIIRVRSLASVGGLTRRAMAKGKPLDPKTLLGPTVGFMPAIVAGLQRAVTFAHEVLRRPTMQSATQQRRANSGQRSG